MADIGEDLHRFNRGHGLMERRLRYRAVLVVALVSAFTISIGSPVGAVKPPPTTTTTTSGRPVITTNVAPYYSSYEGEYCNWTPTCEVTTSAADHQDGSLAVHVKTAGTPTVGFYCWPGCTWWLNGVGARAYAVIDSRHTVQSAKSITFTVEVDVEQASALAVSEGVGPVPDGEAEVTLTAWATGGNCSCSGSTSVVLASSKAAQSSYPATKSLTFTYGSATGTVMSGDVWVRVTLEGVGYGLYGAFDASARAILKSTTSSAV